MTAARALKVERVDADHNPVLTACPHCDGPLVTIELSLSGNDLTMHSCSKCDRRFWANEGENTDLVDLLGRAPVLQPALR